MTPSAENRSLYVDIATRHGHANVAATLLSKMKVLISRGRVEEDVDVLVEAIHIINKQDRGKHTYVLLLWCSTAGSFS